MVEQQARVIAHEVPSAIVRKLHGQLHLDYGGMTPDEWRKQLLRGGNVFVMTPAILHDLLVHGQINIKDIGLLIFDEAHHVSARDEYRFVCVFFCFCCPLSFV